MHAVILAQASGADGWITDLQHEPKMATAAHSSDGF